MTHQLTSARTKHQTLPQTSSALQQGAPGTTPHDAWIAPAAGSADAAFAARKLISSFTMMGEAAVPLTDLVSSLCSSGRRGRDQQRLPLRSPLLMATRTYPRPRAVWLMRTSSGKPAGGAGQRGGTGQGWQGERRGGVAQLRHKAVDNTSTPFSTPALNSSANPAAPCDDVISVAFSSANPWWSGQAPLRPGA